MRKPLSESILLMGGTAMLPGIKSRILSELRHHVKSSKYKEKLFVDSFKVHKSPSHENYTAWLGGNFFSCNILLAFMNWLNIIAYISGSLVGVTEMVNMQSVTKEEYKKEGDIPDWASLKYNIKREDSSGK